MNLFSPLKIVVLLVVLGMTAYGNAIFHPFVHDDVVFIQNNPAIRDLSRIPSIFEKKVAAPSQGSPLVNVYYRPFLEIVYRLEYRLFGLNPHGYHFFNVVGHVVNGILVFWLLCLAMKRLGYLSGVPGRGMAVAGLTAGIFIVHPLQTEAVACISGISNVVYAFFILAGLLLYIHAKDAGAQRRSEEMPIFYWLGLMCVYGMALFSKEQAVVLPVLLILSEVCLWSRYVGPERRTRSRDPYSYFYIMSLISVTALYLLWRTMVWGESLLSPGEDSYEFMLRLRAIPQTLLMYVRLIFFPFDLHYYRSVDILKPMGASLWILVTLVIGMMVALRRLPATSRILAKWGIGWFVLTLLPVLNIIPLVHEYSMIAAFEHFLYLPSLGLFLAVGVAAEDIFRRWPNRWPAKAPAWIVGGAGVVMVLLTWQQNSSWRGEIPLFERVVRFEPRLGRTHILLAKAYYFGRRFDPALREYTAALEIMEGYRQNVRRATAKSGNKHPAAEKFYTDFIKEIHFDIAHCYEAKGDFGKAVEHYRRFLELDPENGPVHNNLGSAYIQLQDFEQAAFHFQEAVRIDGRDVMAMSNLAVCHIQKEEWAAAEGLLQAVLAINPGFLSAKQNLENLLKSHPREGEGK